MIFALLTLLAALALAAVAGWFSIVGFMAIYAGAPMYALIMGVVTECAKLVTTSWVYRNWEHAGWRLKGPLIYFTLALMTATSIGVFGFLSKAHLEQGAGTIDNSAKIEQLQYQIEREKATITDNEKLTKQLDDTVNSLLGKDRADRALSVRKSQAAQRTQLRNDTAEAQKRIDGINAEKFKLESEVRKQQLDVGPIRYIAELFYGATNDTGKNIETAVRIFTLLLVSTLDPLAVILLVAANHTLMRLRNEKDTKTQKEEPARQAGHDNIPETDTPDSQAFVEGPIILPDFGFKDTDNAANNSAPSTETSKTEIHVPLPQETVGLLDEIEEVIEEKVRDIPVETLPHTIVVADPPANDSLYEDSEESTAPEADPEPRLQDEEVIDEEELGMVPTTIQEEDIQDILAPTLNCEDPEEEINITTSPKVPKIQSEGNVNEIEASVLEKFQPKITTTPIAGAISPIPTSVIRPQTAISTEIEEIPSLSTPKIKEVPDAKQPWAQNEAILREILGARPHFIPQKVNEEEKPAIVHPSETGKTDSEIETGIQIEEEAKEIHTEAPGTDKGSDDASSNRNEGTFRVADNKYPKALSWLSEFKRA